MRTTYDSISVFLGFKYDSMVRLFCLMRQSEMYSMIHKYKMN